MASAFAEHGEIVERLLQYPREQVAVDAFVNDFSLNTEYEDLCMKACMFQSPCCHNELYTHLPEAFDEVHPTHPEPPALMVVLSLKRQIHVLRRRLRKFCHHKEAPRDVVIYIVDMFGTADPLVFDHTVRRVMDEERRAALLMSYHAKYNLTHTLCCNFNVCYNNCKR